MLLNLLNMKKILFIIGTILLVSLLFFACNVNDKQVPTFNDKDAYVGFTFLEYTVDEDYCTNPKKGNGGKYRIPVTLASVSGVVSSVTYEVINGTAIADTNFVLKSSKTLNFTADNRVQYIEFEIIDIPGEFTGDFQFSIEIKNGGSVKVGSDKVCKVKIADVDHPLSKILGNYTGSAFSYFDREFSFDVTISKDESVDGKAPDLSKIWFHNFFYLQNVGIYGTVDAELKEIRIPMGQTTTTSAGNPYAQMVGWFVFYKDDGSVNEDLEDEEYDIPDGHNIIIYIENDGQRLIMPPIYELGSYVIGSVGGFFEYLLPFPVAGGGIGDFDMNKPMMTLIKN